MNRKTAILIILLLTGIKVPAQQPGYLSGEEKAAQKQLLQDAGKLFASDVDSSNKILQHVVFRSRKNNDQEGICRAQNGLAINYFVQGKYDLAFELLTENVRYFHTISLAEQVQTYRLLLYACFYTKRYRLAISYGRKGLQVNEKIRTPEPENERLDRLSALYNGLVSPYCFLGRFDSARYFLDRYAQCINENPQPYKLAKAQLYELEGILAGHIGNLDKGLENFRIARARYQAAGPGSQIPEHINALIFDMYIINKRFDLAGPYVPLLLLSREMQGLDFRREILPKIAQVDSAAGNYKDAYLQLQKTLVADDSIQQEELVARSAYYVGLLGLYEKEEQVNRESNAARNTLYLVIIIAVIAIAAIYMLAAYYRNRKLKLILQHKAQIRQIGRDLHDEINPILGYAQMLISRVASDNSNDRQLLSKSAKALEETMDNLRRLTRHFHELPVTQRSYIPALKDMVLKICEAYQFKADIGFNFSETGLSETMQRNLFLLIQELVHNSMKYAEGNRIYLRLDTEYNNLILTYADDGKGLDDKNRTVPDLLPKLNNRILQLGGKAVFTTVAGFPGMALKGSFPFT